MFLLTDLLDGCPLKCGAVPCSGGERRKPMRARAGHAARRCSAHLVFRIYPKVPTAMPRLSAPNLRRAWPRSHGRRPPGGRPRTVARRPRPRPQAAARQAAGAAARPGCGQQG
eukprot:scaffold40849_cov60-Phaeocystis_antarctica.AAC.1